MSKVITAREAAPFEMDKKKDGKPMKWDVADLEEVD